MKALLDFKNLKIMESEKKIVELGEANQKLQEILADFQGIYKYQKEKIESQEKEKSDMEKEFEFWLPGKFYYKDNSEIRTLLENIEPFRKYDEYTKELDEPRLALHGDTTRLK